MASAPRVFVIVGTPGSGKDLLIRAAKDIGSRQVQVVPKHTSRARRADDGPEMICPGDASHDLVGCDVRYVNYGTDYGLQSRTIWDGLRSGISQMCVVSGIDAINSLHKIFGNLLVLVYIHSDTKADEYETYERGSSSEDEYVRRRAEQYEEAFELYMANFLAFSHVLIASAVAEDLYDQIFRLLRGYEQIGTSALVH